MIKRLVGESLIYGISGLIGRLVVVFLVPIYTRIFAPEDFGVIGLVTNLFSLLGILFVLGLDNSIALWYYEDEDEESKRISLNTFFWSCLALALIFAGLIAVFHNSIAVRILQEPSAGLVLVIAAANLPLTVFFVFTSNVLRIQRRAAAASIFTLVTSLLTVLLTIVFIVGLRSGIVGIFYAQVISSLIAVVWTIVLFRNTIAFSRFDWHRWKEMFWFSSPLVPGSVAFWVINLSGVYFIQSFKDAQEVGLYQIGSSIAAAMALLTVAFQTAYAPFALSINKRPKAREIHAHFLTVYLCLACAGAVLITLFAYEMLVVLTTEKYFAAYWVAGILAFNYLIIGAGYSASIGTSLAKNNKMYGSVSLISAGLLVLLNLYLVPKYGKEGAALAVLAAQSIIPVAIFWHSQRLYPIPYNFSKAAVIFLVSLITGFGTLLLLNELSLEFYVRLAVKIAVAFTLCGSLVYILLREINSIKLITDKFSESQV